MASFFIILAVFIWSSLGIIVRMADIRLVYVIFYPASIAFIIQGIVIMTTRERKKIPRPVQFPHLLLLGPVLLLNHLLFFYSFTHTTIANAVLTHYTAPVFVALLSPLLLKELIDRSVIYAMIISSAGLLLLLKGFSLSGEHIAGITAGTLSGLTYAFIIIIGRFVAQNFSPLVITFFQNLMVVLLLAPFIEEIPLKSTGYLVLLGIVHSTIAPLLYIRGLREVRASRAAILGYLEPVGAIAFAFLFFGEVPGFLSIVGGMLIIYSGYLIIMKDSGIQEIESSRN